MLFRQMFDRTSCTYTYLLASRRGGEALLIDPVFEQTHRYLKLLEELDLKLVKVVDTHIHADHVSAMGSLRDATRCTTVMGEQSPADVVSLRVRDGEEVTIEGLALTALHTPGHTSESYSFLMDDRVFTGDTLLIRGTGRTDFQNGDPYAQYDSLFGRLLKLPEATFVFPAHDYKGDTVSTIGEEKAFNPRLQVSSADEYAEIMNALNLPNPMMMDVAVPENLKVGLRSAAQHRVPVVEVAKPPFNSATHRLVMNETVTITRVNRTWAKIALTADELRDRIDPLADLVDLLVADSVIVRGNLKSRLGGP